MIECRPAQTGRTEVIVTGTGQQILRDTSMIITVVVENMIDRQLPKDDIIELVSAAVATGVKLGFKKKEESAK